MREELEQLALTAIKQAEERAQALRDLKINIPVKATEEGKLFGSIGVVWLLMPLKRPVLMLRKAKSACRASNSSDWRYDIDLLLHTDVTTTIKINVVPAE